MTNDEGLKPERAPERSPKAGVGALRASRRMARSAFPFSADWFSRHVLSSASTR
jgi:hypothetical protein